MAAIGAQTLIKRKLCGFSAKTCTNSKNRGCRGQSGVPVFCTCRPGLLAEAKFSWKLCRDVQKGLTGPKGGAASCTENTSPRFPRFARSPCSSKKPMLDSAS